MKKISKILGLGAAGLLLSTNFASAADAIDTVITKGKEVFDGVRKVVFVLGGFGLVGLAMAAIFGKIQWKWFGALAIGLTILGLAGSIINYIVEDTTMGTGQDTIK
ncbi:MAG: TrbC/VIRB2 family protein [Alphaproteobacteria bacterium ADurb.Bin438]|nr:MAG: TrbC/VIRB2 family protein [Alphaproteobacteria bacterium ADurb.Bin438]